ncbi:retrovirus-related pol polyprotein from transposon TNT 1-94 [Tanacetum coccineum]
MQEPSLLSFLATPLHKKGYLLYNLETHKTFIRRYVNFNESLFPFHKQPKPIQTTNNSIPADFHPIPNTPLNSPASTPTIIEETNPSLTNPTSHTTSQPSSSSSSILTESTTSPSQIQTESPAHTKSPPQTESLIQPNPQPIPDPPQPRQHTIPLKFKDFHYKLPKIKHTSQSCFKFHYTKYINYKNIYSPKYRHLFNTINNTVEQQSYTQAIKDVRWVDAMSKEMQALEANNTWTIASLPPNKTLIGSKWVFRIKCNSDGSIERFKGRLVAKGFNQNKGIDYNETFSLVAMMVTVKTFLATTVSHNWYIS